jgi:hypothetical protein
LHNTFWIHSHVNSMVWKIVCWIANPKQIYYLIYIKRYPTILQFRMKRLV